MDTNERISSYYQEYKANMEAARTAEKRGNIEGARKLYRQAALALCEMANLESGETKKQRIMHAEQILRAADSLKEQPAAAPAGQGKPPVSGQAASGQTASAPGDDNPWVSEGIPSATFDDVVGMEDVKQLFRDRVIDQIKYPELYQQYGLKGGTGVLLFGLPGTGKTTIARAVAHEIGAPLYTVNISDILNKWVGESEKRIRQLFEKARVTPVSMIFFDDFDALGRSRTDDGSHGNQVIVELITQMDGFRKNDNTIVLLAATNKPWMIDSALMRPGRFEHHVYVPLPNQQARVMLIQKTLGGVPVDPGLDLNEVSGLLAGYNGADIVSVVNSAKVAGVQRAKEYRLLGEERISPITLEDFNRAASAHKSSVDPQDIVRMRQYAQQRGIEMPSEL